MARHYDGPENVELEVAYKHESDSAVLFDHEGDDVWIPKSCIVSAYDPDEEELQSIYVQGWFAYDKGLI